MNNTQISKQKSISIDIPASVKLDDIKITHDSNSYTVTYAVKEQKDGYSCDFRGMVYREFPSRIDNVKAEYRNGALKLIYDTMLSDSEQNSNNVMIKDMSKEACKCDDNDAEKLKCKENNVGEKKSSKADSSKKTPKGEDLKKSSKSDESKKK